MNTPITYTKWTAERVKELRSRIGATQKEMVDVIPGLPNYQQWQRWEQGKVEFSYIHHIFFDAIEKMVEK